MMKKMLMLLVCCFMFVGCAKEETKTPEKEIRLEVIIKDEVNKKELFNETITQKGNIKTLYDFLEACEELEVKFNKGSYGTYIESIKGMKQDFDKGPWWLFSSENNDVCVENGMCPTVKEVTIEDGDQFVFSYTNSF